MGFACAIRDLFVAWLGWRDWYKDVGERVGRCEEAIG